MIEISYLQIFILITIIWTFVRFAIAVRSKKFSAKRELQMLLVYICLVVITRFVYFPLHRVDGKIGTLTIGFSEAPSDMVSIIPFYFLFDRYDGWLINVIGNIAMFIPVGIVWPICFRELDNIIKTVLAGVGLIIFIELSQLLCIDRHTDIDDVILNTCGVLIGAGIIFTIRMVQKHEFLRNR